MFVDGQDFIVFKNLIRNRIPAFTAKNRDIGLFHPEGLATEVLAAVKMEEAKLPAIPDTLQSTATGIQPTLTWDINTLGSPYPACCILRGNLRPSSLGGPDERSRASS